MVYLTCLATSTTIQLQDVNNWKCFNYW